MKRTLLFIGSLVLIVSAAAAQQNDSVKYWTRSGNAGFNFSQVSLSNWAAGGDASVAFDLRLNYSLDYKKGKNMWNNRLEMEYGLNNTSSLGSRKVNDRIFFSSTYGYNIGRAWYASAFVTFDSQFANGYDYSSTPNSLLSQFMAPGYLTVGAGFTWTPKTWFTATFSPAAWRGTFVLNDDLSDAGAFGVDPGKHMRSEFGANVILEANYEFLKNMTIYSRLTLFSNYLDKPQNVDVNWNNQLSMKINEWFSANVSLNMIYDDDTRFEKDGRQVPLLQVKEVFGVGLSFAF